MQDTYDEKKLTKHPIDEDTVAKLIKLWLPIRNGTSSLHSLFGLNIIQNVRYGIREKYLDLFNLASSSRIRTTAMLLEPLQRRERPLILAKD